MENVKQVLENFKKYVIQQSKANLTIGRMVNGKKASYRDSDSLYNNITGEVIQDNDYYLIGFKMPFYGQFVDLGVKGKSSSEKAPNSPYQFGKGTQKGGLTKSILEWVKRKNIQFRAKNGRFITHESTGYLITLSIFHKGIKPSLFFTKPFEAGYKKYIDTDLIKAFGADIDNIIDFE